MSDSPRHNYLQAARRSARQAEARHAASEAAVQGWNAAIASQDDPPLRNIMFQVNRVDVADMLPPAARAYFVALREEAQDVQNAYWSLGDEWNEARLDVLKAETELQRHTDPDIALRSGFPRPVIRTGDNGEEATIVLELRARIEQAKAKFDRLTQRRDALSARAQQAKRLVTRAEEYLKGAWSGHPFEAFTGKTKKFSSIDAARAEIDRLKAERDAAYIAPHPSSSAKARVRAEIEALAKRGMPNLLPAVHHGEPVGWKRTKLDLTNPPAQTPVTGQGIDVLGLLAWVFGYEIIAALDTAIDEVADDTNAMTDEQRTAALTRLASDILDAERAEVAMVAAAGVEHRADSVDIRALLGIVGPARED
ncbi:hypothetical protein EN817_03810 [Mesorhizobium sp. M3A.F.Ca.ET.174.01.1.1]|uniref:hypothetical protein n=1 Tax=unclassified Mesorhizobium TaxID=325217 RepID=UPI00109392FC|nr:MULTISPECIES: hypothetical protein [unclassified Mesorhizobium]TGS89476.1 hypothetical protein EN818_03810 [Mesorhizobium sp. M3A.F.Ca.ET.175.01.1.1]TGT31249.1 hypothetical protein EN817_03810 [Mesorhizobium sp. M3A.F.Ca.ET.174.01.1.1]